MRLQSILQPASGICGEESLYTHRTGSVIRFDGYFNLFYIEKWKKYTGLAGLRLTLRLRGFRTLRLMRGTEELAQEALSPEKEETVSVSFPWEKTEGGVFWFSLEEEAEGSGALLWGFYEGDAEEIRPVNIAADICTFRREEYVARNLRSICSFLRAENAPEAAEHLRVIIVDNGRTLLQDPEIRQLLTASGGIAEVIPNRNAGGTGGFTRGMMEAIRRKEELGLTHVLLMDDDAVFDPELFIRLYGFLSIVKDAYRKITMGGTLLREDYPYIQQAAGEWYGNFRGWNDHPLYDLRTFENCTADFMTQAEDPHPGKTYSGWWCCCYSMENVREDNLPLPLFLHHDDITYGLKNAGSGVVFLPGIGGWHKGFGMTFAGSNQYYDIRNPLITASFFEPEMTALRAVKKIWFALTAMLIQYRYAEAYLTWRGLLDYLKGPEWLMRTDGEKLHGKLREFCGKHFALKPFEELPEARYGAVKEAIRKACGKFGMAEITENEQPQRLKKKLFQMMTFNGWFLPGKEEILAVSATDSPFKGFRHKEIVLYEPVSGRAIAAKRNYRMLAQFVKIYGRSAWLLLTRWRKTAAAYRAKEQELTGMAMWEKYLR